jgi:hypothetical protein
MPSKGPDSDTRSHSIESKPNDHPKTKDSTDIDDAQLDGVTDDSAFSKDTDESEITDENQRSESRVERRRRI